MKYIKEVETTGFNGWENAEAEGKGNHVRFGEPESG